MANIQVRQIALLQLIAAGEALAELVKDQTMDELQSDDMLSLHTVSSNSAIKATCDWIAALETLDI